MQTRGPEFQVDSPLRITLGSAVRPYWYSHFPFRLDNEGSHRQSSHFLYILRGTHASTLYPSAQFHLAQRRVKIKNIRICNGSLYHKESAQSPNLVLPDCQYIIYIQQSTGVIQPSSSLNEDLYQGSGSACRSSSQDSTSNQQEVFQMILWWTCGHRTLTL